MSKGDKIMLAYPVTIAEDSGWYIVESVDFPNVTAHGESKEEALADAVNAIATGVSICIRNGQPVPTASPAIAGQPVVVLPTQVVLKALLHGEMLRQKVTKADLARRLGWRQTQAARLLDVRHASKLDAIDLAFGALGQKLDVSVRTA